MIETYHYSQATTCFVCGGKKPNRLQVTCGPCWNRVPPDLVREFQQTRGKLRKDVVRRILLTLGRRK